MIDWKLKPQKELIEEAVLLAKKSRSKRPRQHIHTNLSNDTYKIINKLMNKYDIKNKNEIIEIALFYMNLVKEA